MSVHKGYADVGALRMYYELHGEARPGRAPLLLIHGSGSTIESNFGELIPLLTGTRQVIGVEEQGHGHTPRGPAARSRSSTRPTTSPPRSNGWTSPTPTSSGSALAASSRCGWPRATRPLSAA